MKVIVEADGGSRGNPGPAGYGSVVWSADHRDGARREQAGHRPRHQQRRRISRADRGSRGGGEAGRHRRRGLDGFQACGGTDVGSLAGQAPRPRPAASTSHGLGNAIRPHQLHLDPAVQERSRRPAGQRSHGRRRRTRDGGAARSRRRPPKHRLPGLDRGPRHADAVTAAATRTDRVVHAAPLFGPREPGTDRRRPPAGRRRRAISGAARRDRGGGHLAAATGLRHRGDGGQGTGARRHRRRRPDRDRFRGLGGIDVQRGRRTGSGVASPLAARHQRRRRRTGKASTAWLSGCGGLRIGSSPNMALRRCWWCRT